jgi:hypothetical protein
MIASLYSVQRAYYKAKFYGNGLQELKKEARRMRPEFDRYMYRN